MSKVKKLNARRKISNRPARVVYPPLTQEQEEAFEKVKKKWDKHNE